MKARKREKAHRAEVEESIVSANGQLTRLQEGIARAERHVVSLEGERTKKDGFLLETLERIAGKEIEVQLITPWAAQDIHG